MRGLLLLACLTLLGAGPKTEVYIAGGAFTPMLAAKGSKPVQVAPFYLDRDPVTNAQFLKFVKAHPEWRRSRIPRLYAEPGYLQDWDGDLHFDPDLADRPVTSVSWFAARAYCRALGKRLPRENEWEFVARASQNSVDATRDPQFLQMILDWYARPTPTRLGKVGEAFQNVYGIRGMHGLVWEWVDDFNSSLVTGESRQDNSVDRNLYCAGGAVGAVDPSNYAAFMRYAFRSSLQARFTVRNLGFRCARDARR